MLNPPGNLVKQAGLQARTAEEQRLAEEKRRAEEVRLAEEKRITEEEARLAEEKRKIEEAAVVARSDGFRDNGDGSLTDSKTGLVWTQRDNGSDIYWNSAKAYCEGKGMRLPTIEELAGNYDRGGTACNITPSKLGNYTCKASSLFNLTSPAFWSGTQNGSSEAWYFNLNSGYRLLGTASGPDLRRALCVRRGS